MATQSNRTLKVATPLGTDVLLIQRLTGTEQISQLFHYDLQLISEDGEVQVDKILGKAVTVQYLLPDNAGTRFFSGFVTEFSQVAYQERYHQYRAVVRPWFWFLTRTSDCRIFQAKSVPQIFNDVAKAAGFSDFKLKLQGTYASRDYCVQYRETDFNFLSRLMELEGIHYYFEHQDGKHIMVLADDPSAHTKIAGYETVPYFPPTAPGAQRTRDHLESWSFSKSVQPGSFATTDYDYLAPKTPLSATEVISRSHDRASFEMFDYPADLAKPQRSESERIAKIRIQELQSTQTVASGHGNAAGLAAGHRFKLEKYPRADLNHDYLIVGTAVTVHSDEHGTGGGGDVEFSISGDAVDATQPFRPARVTPKPLIQGAQTAIVVGGSGDEIFTDKYGRVKVQFYWDRQGNKDDKSGCWIRVSQIWSGDQWGSMHIPRVGQEVIVSFLDGDPDRPIITGRVYNGDLMPPYSLPDNKTQSGIKSRSSKDGSPDNFNEIRFEDKKGEELVTIHAEKNHELSVENDENHTVGHDETHSVGHDESHTVGNDRKKGVGNNENVSIGKNRTESVGDNESITVGKNRSVSVGASESLDVSKDQTESIGGSRTLSVGKDESITVSGSRTDQVGKNEEVTVSENRTHTVGKNDTLTISKKFIIDAGDEIVIKTGSASITMKSDGTISIAGQDISIEGSGKINVKASGDIAMKGSKISQN
jgi:type VI secretion system secreted protein VgrG